MPKWALLTEIYILGPITVLSACLPTDVIHNDDKHPSPGTVIGGTCSVGSRIYDSRSDGSRCDDSRSDGSRSGDGSRSSGSSSEVEVVVVEAAVGSPLQDKKTLDPEIEVESSGRHLRNPQTSRNLAVLAGERVN